MSKNKTHKDTKKEPTKVQSSATITPIKQQPLLLSLIIVFCIPVLLYIQTTTFGLTNFDDDGIISNNMPILSNLKNIPQAFTCDAYVGKTSEFYRPIQTMTYMFDVHFSNTTAFWMFHLTNVLLFGLIACLLFLVLLRFSIPQSLAVIATLVYCVNPLFTSSVAWIPSRGDLLLTVFSLSTFILFIDYTKTGKFIYLILHWLSFTIALFCKETAAFIPFVLFLYFIIFTKNILFDFKNIVTILLYAISGIFWFYIRSRSIDDVSDMPDQFQVGILAVVNNLRSIPEAFASFVLPFQIAVIPGFTILKTSLGIVVIGFIVFLFFKNKERLFSEKLFGLLWFLLLLVPTMFFRHKFIDYLNHRFLLPFVGILLFSLLVIPKQWIDQKASIIFKIGIALVIVLSIVTFKNLRSYASPQAFYDAAIEQNPQNALAYNNRGNLKFMDKNYQAALDDFNAAAAIGNTMAETYMNIGLSLYNLNNFKEAVVNYDKYIVFRPKKAEPYINKGMALGSLGDFKGAIICFTKAIALRPNYMEAYGNRAIARMQIKDYTGVIDDCKMVLKLKPSDETAKKIMTDAQQFLKQ